MESVQLPIGQINGQSQGQCGKALGMALPYMVSACFPGISSLCCRFSIHDTNVEVFRLVGIALSVRLFKRFSIRFYPLLLLRQEESFTDLHPA